MERRTPSEIRREKFNREGQIARELADLALRDIDEALAEHWKAAYATYDDGATSPSTYSDLFEPLPDPPEAA